MAASSFFAVTAMEPLSIEKSFFVFEPDMPGEGGVPVEGQIWPRGAMLTGEAGA